MVSFVEIGPPVQEKKIFEGFLKIFVAAPGKNGSCVSRTSVIRSFLAQL